MRRSHEQKGTGDSRSRASESSLLNGFLRSSRGWQGGVLAATSMISEATRIASDCP